MNYEEEVAKVEVRVIPETFEVEYRVRFQCKATVPYDDAAKYEKVIAHGLVNKLKNAVIKLTDVDIINSIEEQYEMLNEYRFE